MTAGLLERAEVDGWLYDPWAGLPAEFAGYAPLIPDERHVPDGKPFGSPVFGQQRPQVFSCPKWVTSAGGEAIEKAAEAGLILDPWEAWFLIHALGETAEGRWSSFAVKMTVSRQNGKGSILEARELAGLFVFGEEVLIHSAHRFNTCQLAYQRILTRIENTRSMIRKVARMPASHGEEAIELFPTPTIITGASSHEVTVSRTPTLRFLARTKAAARGFTGDLVVLDEDMILDADECAAMIPAISARGRLTQAGPQVWYMGSAGIGKPSTQAARVRRRGYAGGTSLCFAEWAVELHDEYCPRPCEDKQHVEPAATSTIAAANPGLGLRLELALSLAELDELGLDKWARERLGVGQYPSAEDGWAVISEAMYKRRVDRSGAKPSSVVAGVDVAPYRTAGAIVVCGDVPEGRRGIEIYDHRPGSGWVVKSSVELNAANGGALIFVVDPRTDAGSLIEDLTKAGLRVEQMRAQDVAQAFGQIYDAWRGDELRYPDDKDLRKAVAGADVRKLSEGLAWDRVNSSVDITTLTAGTFAHWGHKRWGGDLDYDTAESVGYDVTEVARYYHQGTYGPHDLVRLASLGILRTADLGALEQLGVPIPAGLAVRD